MGRKTSSLYLSTFGGRQAAGEGRSASSVQVRAVLIAVLLFFAGAAANGQVRSATISGTIQDASGKVIVGADVVVLEVATNQSYNAKSNETGNFTVPYLPGGSYTVTVKQQGFQTSAQEGIAVGTGDSIHLDIDLKTGSVNEVVQVDTEASGIQVDSPTVQSAVGETVIASLPNIAHNPLSYVGLQAGVIHAARRQARRMPRRSVSASTVGGRSRTSPSTAVRRTRTISSWMDSAPNRRASMR